MKVLIWLLAIISPCINAQTFPLNKAIPDKAIVCLTKDAAVAIAETVEEINGALVLVRHMKEGTCFAIEGMMTYTSKVHETKKHFYVYQMTFGKLTGFVPTNQKSAGTDI